MEKRTTLKEAATLADGRSRRCCACPCAPCKPGEFDICTKAFREGFVKGAFYKAKKRAQKGGTL